MRSTQIHSANGNSSHVGQKHRAKGSFPPAAVPSAVTEGQVVDIVLKMHSDLFEHGFKRAELRRDVDANTQDLQALEEHAEAMAREAYRGPYDPDKNEEHNLRQIEYKKLQESRPEAQLVLSYAEADVARLEDEISQAGSNMTSPTRAQVLMISAVGGLALTIAPTMHDFVFITMKDDILNWAVSLLSAAVYGIFITWGLLDCDDEDGRRTVRNWLALAGGISLPVGLGIMRAANAVGMPEILFAVALTVVELGIVLLLESRAISLRIAYQEWADQLAVLNEITMRLEAARDHLARCKQELAKINDAIQLHIRFVEELSVRNFNIDKITADAIKAVRDGYSEGLAKNRGYLRGRREAA